MFCCREICMAATRPARPGKSVRWTDLSVQRRELKRAAVCLLQSLSKNAGRKAAFSATFGHGRPKTCPAGPPAARPEAGVLRHRRGAPICIATGLLRPWPEQVLDDAACGGADAAPVRGPRLREIVGAGYRPDRHRQIC